MFNANKFRIVFPKILRLRISRVQRGKQTVIKILTKNEWIERKKQGTPSVFYIDAFYFNVNFSIRLIKFVRTFLQKAQTFVNSGN